MQLTFCWGRQRGSSGPPFEPASSCRSTPSRPARSRQPQGSWQCGGASWSPIWGCVWGCIWGRPQAGGCCFSGAYGQPGSSVSLQRGACRGSGPNSLPGARSSSGFSVTQTQTHLSFLLHITQLIPNIVLNSLKYQVCVFFFGQLDTQFELSPATGAECWKLRMNPLLLLQD